MDIYSTLLARSHMDFCKATCRKLLKESLLFDSMVDHDALNPSSVSLRVAIKMAVRLQMKVESLPRLGELDSQTGTPEEWIDDETDTAMENAYEEYRQRYTEQKKLLKNNHFFFVVSAAIARMPLQRICITDISGRWDNFCRTGWDMRKDAEMFTNSVMGPNLLQHVTLRPGAWEDSLLDGAGRPPISWLYTLPPILLAKNETLTHLDITITPPMQFLCDMKQEKIEDLRNACRLLEAVDFRVTVPSRKAEHPTLTLEVMASYYEFLKAILVSPHIQQLKIAFTMFQGDWQIESPTMCLCDVLYGRSWEKLRALYLDQFPIHMHALEEFLGKVSNT